MLDRPFELGGSSILCSEVFTKLVRPEGFEPPTNGFGSHYSIQLSYERKACMITSDGSGFQ